MTHLRDTLPPVKILLIEDNPGDARLVQIALSEQVPHKFLITWMERLIDALALMDAEPFDIVLSDLLLPDSTGLATVQAIFAHSPAMPLVVLTGSNGKDTGHEVIRLGAQDFIAKHELSAEILGWKLHYAIERQHLKRQLHQANTALEQRVSERTTELQTALQDLSQSEIRHRSLFQGALDAIFITDEHSHIVDANPAACRVSGYSVEELKGRHYAELIPAHFRTRARQAISEFRLSGIMDMEFPFLVRDGHERTVRVSGSSISGGLYVCIARDITERKQAAEAMKRLAYNDALTQLPNRAALQMRLNKAIEQAQAYGHSMALLLLDLNNFREINDTLGHHNGDRVLMQVAGRLSSVLGESDVLARLGGDEFAVLLPQLADRDHIDKVVHKIHDVLRPEVMVEGVPLDVQTAIGIALYPEHGRDADTLLRHADVAMYTAKETHCSHLLYSSKADHYNPQQLALMAELRLGLQREELTLHYQPQVDIKTGHVVGVEALVRWQHPTRGLLYPDTFIPAAEKTGLIAPLTTWVLANALRQQQIWHLAGIELHISVNLSVRNLQQADIVSEISNALRSSGVQPEWLTLEITESAIMIDPERAKSVLAQLHDLGVNLAIDDFGIGHSSLAYLKQLPIDTVKVDKSFVMDLENPANAAIVRATIDLAHNLGLWVIAEGVEDESALDTLILLGCEQAQGYHMSRPQTVDKLGEWLLKSPWGLPLESA